MELHSVGLIQAEDGRKMSKRWGNVINPDEIVERLGADTLRVYEMFMGPFENTIAWSTDSMVGARRFLERVFEILEIVQDESVPELEAELHKTIAKVGNDVVAFKFNTAISQMMIFVNLAEKVGRVGKEQLVVFLKILAPFAPHLTEELWNQLGEEKSVHLSSWPAFDEEKLIRDTVTMAVQINGKVRDEIEVSAEIEKEELEKKVLARPAVLKWTQGRTIQRTIYVPGKLINIVV
jgi:leucyl-tRNA synthetase